MCLSYVDVAYVINETNTSNSVVEHLTSELNERTTDDFDDSWLRHNDTFQTIPMEGTSTLYKAYGIVNYSYYSWIICIVSLLTFLHFLNHVIVLSQLSLVERRRAKDRERWSKRYLNMTNDQKAKKKCQQAIN